MTQRNAAMVEESNAATHAIEQESQQLHETIKRFKVHDKPDRNARGAGIQGRLTV